MRFSTIRRFLTELRRRRVSRVAAVYVVVSWVLLQLGNIVVDPLLLPEWTMSLLIVLLVLGFPVALMLAWALEITPEGIRRSEPTAPAEMPGGSSPLPRPGVRTVAVIGTGALVITAGMASYALVRDRSVPVEAGADAPRVIAVLPFENRSPDSANEFFADGVTDDILTHLGQVGDLAVVSRTTSMGYKHSDKSVPRIAEELGVQYVLEGSVQLVDSRVRISARLVDGRADRHLWADSYDRQLEDVFTVQTEIAQAIVEALEVELTAGVAVRIERPPTGDLEAYELFLLGRESYRRRDLEGTERAIELFRRALDRDPEFALARSWLARGHLTSFVNHGMGEAWADSAVAQARRSVAEQPDLAEAYSSLGSALTFTGRYEEAVTALERGMELNPNDWDGASTLAVAYSHLGLWDEAIRITRRALALEGVRLTSVLHPNLAWYALHLGLLDHAEAALRPALTVQPYHPYNVFIEAWIALLRGERDAALRAAERLATAAGEEPIAGLYAAHLFVFASEPERATAPAEAAVAQSPTAIFDWITVDVLYGHALERGGRQVRSRAVLAEAERHARERIRAGNERRAFRYSLARIHALRGEIDEAFHWLDEAVRLGWNVAGVTAADPLLETLRGDPRFDDALRRMERSTGLMRERVLREDW